MSHTRRGVLGAIASVAAVGTGTTSATTDAASDERVPRVTVETADLEASRGVIVLGLEDARAGDVTVIRFCDSVGRWTVTATVDERAERSGELLLDCEAFDLGAEWWLGATVEGAAILADEDLSAGEGVSR